MTMQAHLDAAYAYMLALIEDGMEYPEAQWKAAHKFHVSADALQEMYDEA